MRDAPLTAIKGGLNRLRTKGGARADSLYDLLNGYVTKDRTVKVRPGTVRVQTLDSNTKGLVSFQGSIHVFASTSTTVPAGYILHILTHPDTDEDTTVPLERIHFARPYLGYLYVVAEFDDTGYDERQIFHFWLQSGGVWEADKIYHHGDIVEPTVANGIAYQATRLSSPLPSWQAGVPRTIGDQIEPTVYNDFFYTVVDTVGDNPISGTTEPEWPEEDGARIFEDTEGFADETPTTTEPPSTQQPTSSVVDRYEL